ncbi:PREDICTED: cyclin-dependent kinase inhibitor 4-like [Tarenaya hassleriana]|uniref:cyclin-dependent kinase inhibitor 4-like n=1 Tax=Tarenaya hassleriana TaxID=28532 RepID=UPI00053C3E36|nr:PREDICTED: cyclin-dependent kinase inhibitor 4-like [Tarenaya hassleriana]
MKRVGKRASKHKRKSKTAGEGVASMDVSHSSIGVLTRAKSLALQKSSSSLPTFPPPSPPSPQQQQQLVDGGGPFLQLRNRRLQKKPSIVVIRSGKRRKLRKKAACVECPNPNSKKLDSPVGSLRGGSGGDGSRSGSFAESVVCAKEKEMLVDEKEANKDLGVDSSPEENIFELEGRERTTRESTPCSVMRNPETVRIQSEESLPVPGGRNLPTTHEMDEFFSGAEEEQQRQFIEKYNFDPVNEKPLPGRYKWKRVDH